MNGLAVVDRKPSYATALGETDTPAGWREVKAHGGVLIDIPSGECAGQFGLHAPRNPRIDIHSTYSPEAIAAFEGAYDQCILGLDAQVGARQHPGDGRLAAAGHSHQDEDGARGLDTLHSTPRRSSARHLGWRPMYRRMSGRIIT